MPQGVRTSAHRSLRRLALACSSAQLPVQTDVAPEQLKAKILGRKRAVALECPTEGPGFQ
jgi:hypothetical protein